MTGAELVDSKRFGAVIHRYPLLVVATAVATGILTDHLFPARVWVWSGLFVVFVLGLWKLPIRHRLITISLLMIPIAAARHAMVESDHRQATILDVVTETSAPAVIEGYIDRPLLLRRHPLADQMTRRDLSPWQTLAEMRIRSARVGQRQQPFGGRALVVIDGEVNDVLPGDHVKVFGWANQFLPPSNPGCRDLRDVYRRRELHVRINVDSSGQIVHTDPDTRAGSKLPFWVFLYRVVGGAARASREILFRHTDETTGPLAVALVVGQREFVDHRTRDALLVTGTAHLLSVSGLHLAIVMALAGYVAAISPLPMKGRIAFVLAICIAYTLITGGRPPVLRACLLAGAVMVSLWIKRPNQPLNSLALAGIVLLLWNPELLFSIGVQLSFLAVTTLLICGRKDRGISAMRAARRKQSFDELIEESRPTIERYMRRSVYAVRQMAWFSGCVTVISMPLVWFQFNVVSLISVLVNVLLFPMLFIALASGIATVLLGAISDTFAVIPGWICQFIISWMRFVIETATSVPFGHFWLPAPPGVWVVVFYVVLLFLLWRRPGVGGRKHRYGWIVCWMLVAYFVSTRPSDLPAECVEATFVDVGHGTCVVLRFADDDVWLYDCGRLGNNTGSSRDIDATLWSMGVAKLTGVILSHADSDHYNALPGVIRRFGVGQIVTPPGMLDEHEPALRQTRRAIKKTQIPIREVAASDEIRAGTHVMSVVHPPQKRIEGSDNANSLVLRIDHEGKSLLLPGDLEPPGTDVLVRDDRPPPGGVLMAPHHGSLRMDAATVLQWARPRETIVSGGERAKRPEVKEMLSEAGSNVYVTAAQGAIRVLIKSDGIVEVRTWNESPW